MKTMDLIVLALMAATGWVIGAVTAGLILVLFTPAWPVAIIALLAAPLGIIVNTRPWEGRSSPAKRWREIKAFIKEMFGPPVTVNGYGFIAGYLVGVGMAGLAMRDIASGAG